MNAFTLYRRLSLLLLIIVPGTLFAQVRNGNNTLPVMFDQVKISLRNNGVLVEWTNLTERELLSYVVERSSDAKNYQPLTVIQPRSNLNEPQSYTYTDASPGEGVNYYRIRCNEMSGKTIYSKILKLATEDKGSGLVVYPNPVITGQLSWSVSGLEAGSYRLSILNAAGVQVYQLGISIQSKAITETIQLPGSLAAGLYRLVLQGVTLRASRSFIIQ